MDSETTEEEVQPIQQTEQEYQCETREDYEKFCRAVGGSGFEKDVWLFV